MFKNVSWLMYLSAVGVAVVLYYIIVGIKFYRQEIREFVTGEGKRKARVYAAREEMYREAEEPTEEIPFVATPKAGKNDDSEYAEVEDLLERIRLIIGDRQGKKVHREEFMEYIKQLFKEYPSIKKSTLRFSINEFVASECEKTGAVQLSEGEVEMLWENAG